MSPDRGRAETYLFLHLMKTGGTSFKAHLVDEFPPGALYPDPRTDPLETYDGLEYGSLSRLRAAYEADRGRIRVFTGHLPFLASRIVEADATLTLLREPIERTISALRQVQAADPAAPRSLEEIYERDYARWTVIQDYQARQFALTEAELEATGALIDRYYPGNARDAADIAHHVHVAMDDARLARAVANLESVDVVGLQADFDGFLTQLRDRFGWSLSGRHRRRVATVGDAPSESLRRRIAEDNPYETAFYEAARQLVERRSGRRITG